MSQNPYESPLEVASEYSPAVVRLGRTILLIHIALVLAISVAVTVLYVSARGTERLPTQIVRFALTVALCSWIYRGSRAARRIAVFLYVIAIAMIVMTLTSTANVAAFTLQLSMFAVYLSFTTVLLFSRKVNAFLEMQAARRP